MAIVISTLKCVLMYRTVKMMTMTGQRKPLRRPSGGAWRRSATMLRT